MRKICARKYLAALMVTIVAAGVFFASCNKQDLEDVDQVKMHYSYFPLSTGSWYEYNVDSMVFDPFFNHGQGRWDTMRYQMRVEVDTPFLDNEGETAYKILRYSRIDENMSWGFPQVMVAKRTSRGVEKVEHNQRYLSLIFPVESNRSWNGNIYNQAPRKDEYNYHYTTVHRPLELNGKRYDSTATIELIDVKSAIERFYIIERYAAGVGLVYRQEVDTNLFRRVNNRPVLSGHINYKSLVNYSIK